MNFDEIIKEKLESYQAPANANAWKEFESNLSHSEQTTPFAVLLISGIAATIVITVLFTTLPDIKSNSIESSRIEENDIALVDTTIKVGASNEISESSEHVAQESHTIPLVIVENKTGSEIGETAVNQATIVSHESEIESQITNASNEEENKKSDAARHENINFTASGIQCPNSNITFTAKLDKAASVIWVFDGLEVKNGIQVKHNFKDAGAYTARMIVKFQDGYEQSITQSIEVYDTPSASFEMNTVSDESCFDQIIELKGTPNSNTYKWVIDGDTAGKGDEFSKAVSKDFHTVGMHTINEWGCTSYEDKSFRVESGLRLDIPTAFSPTRQDGLNDTWKVEGLNNVATFHIEIKRLSTNQIVFESNESTEWDGSIHGYADRIEAGEIFTYQIIATDNCGRTKQFSKTIHYL